MISRCDGYSAAANLRRLSLRLSYTLKAFRDYVDFSRASQIEFEDVLVRFNQLQLDYLCLRKSIEELECPDEFENSSLVQQFLNPDFQDDFIDSFRDDS